MKNQGDKSFKVVQALAPASYAAAAEAFTSGIDCQGFDELLVILHCGVFTATGDLTCQLEESSDDADADSYADITGATFSEVTVSNDNTDYVGRIDLAKRERYIRLGYDVDDDDGIFGVTFILSNAKVRPVTQINTVSFSV